MAVKLDEKERVAAALENRYLLAVVNRCLMPAMGTLVMKVSCIVQMLLQGLLSNF